MLRGCVVVHRARASAGGTGWLNEPVASISWRGCRGGAPRTRVGAGSMERPPHENEPRAGLMLRAPFFMMATMKIFFVLDLRCD